MWKFAQQEEVADMPETAWRMDHGSTEPPFVTAAAPP